MNGSEALNPLYFLPVFLLLFAGLWCGVCFIISRMGGWSALAELYRHSNETFSGESWRWQSGRMRFGARYNNVLNLGANPSGLKLGVVAPFRLGHPELFIPWRDIEVHEEQGLLLGCTAFEFRKAGVSLRVSPSLGRRILSAAGRQQKER